MPALNMYTQEELQELYKLLSAEHRSYVEAGTHINMARGKPSPEQLSLSDDLLLLTKNDIGVTASDGTDCRNYGVLLGLPECRTLFGELFGVPSKNVIIGGVSSLSLMYDYISQCCTHGIGGYAPWIQDPDRKFIAIVPGYDRHFAIAQHFGLKMINVPMTNEGPDMDLVETIVRDPSVKGMFCVPKYSNPDGITYSERTVERIAAMKTAAPDFRVMWDEAYVVHDLYEEQDSLANAFALSVKYGNEDRFVAFASTSKITYAGAGVAALAASDRNIDEIAKRMTLQIISFDKINQLRHCAIFRTMDDIRAHMKKHAQLLRPKFDAVLTVLHRELDGLEIASFNSPRGGYFISLDVNVGSAKRVGSLCSECGLTLTGVGATFPYGVDPNDANIRIAPSLPSVQELDTAANILCNAVKMAACEELLSNITVGR